LVMRYCGWCSREMPYLVNPHPHAVYSCNDCLRGDVVLIATGEPAFPHYLNKPRDPEHEAVPRKGTPEFEAWNEDREEKYKRIREEGKRAREELAKIPGWEIFAEAPWLKEE
jgi:hypothetical protein